MKRIDPVGLGIIIVTLAVVGGIIVAASLNQAPVVSQYQLSDADRPKLEIGETSFDFGRVSVTEIKIKEIEIKNAGAQPLILYGFFTSCDCTFAEVSIGGQTSPKFSMRDKPNWQGRLLPGETGWLKIIYEPRIMPVKGAIRREVVFKTNDPSQPLVNVRFIAQVE